MIVNVPAKIAESDNLAQQYPARRGSDWLWGLILFLAVMATYSPVWWAGYVWDDDIHLTANPCIVGSQGLTEIWTTSAASICPLTLTALWVEHKLWGLAPLPYHLVNVFLQAACSILLWRILRSLRIPGAWLGAALWALHPLQVESVAWVAEMKNTQSCLFYLLAILFFVRWLRAGDKNEGSGPNYPLLLLFSALAIASKFSTVVLPAVLILCAWWVEGRWPWRQLIRLTPILAMSAVASGATFWQGALAPALSSDQLARSWPERMATAGDVIWFYLGKLIWPYPLMTIYPRWQIDSSYWVSYLPIVAVILVLLILWLKRETWGRPYLFAAAYFLVVLLPFLGFIDQSFWRFSFVEDHLQYLAGMGPLALVGAGMSWLTTRIIPRNQGLHAISAGNLLSFALVVILSMVTWQRAWVYRSSDTLWSDALAKNPNCWAGYLNLGLGRMLKGETDEAINDYRKALEINPSYVEAFNNLGNALLKKGQVDEAMVQFQTASKINSNYAPAESNWGNGLMQGGRLDEAMAHYLKALEINPDYTDAHINLGMALVQKGQVDEGIIQFQKALDIDPHSDVSLYNLGNALGQKGRLDEAIAKYRKAVELNPKYAEAFNNLGLALLQKGQADEAIAAFQKALEINSNFDTAHYNLGNALSQKGRMDEAMAQYEKAVEINPGFAEAHSNLANGLLQAGRVDEAIGHYQKALEIHPKSVETLNNLGMALLQKSWINQAIIQFKKALEIDPNSAAVHNNLGLALIQNGQVRQAMTHYQEALRVKPDYAEAQANLAKAQEMARKNTGGK